MPERTAFCILSQVSFFLLFFLVGSGGIHTIQTAYKASKFFLTYFFFMLIDQFIFQFECTYISP